MLENLESSFLHTLGSIIPALTYSTHKGMMGRMSIIGGSKDYTGAPFYAAEGAIKFGADLSFVYCSSNAAVPIKCYSPELMVTSFYDDIIMSEFPADKESSARMALHDEV